MRSRFIIPAVFTTLLASLLHAGPLNPPPGPITSTHKTLTEIEPRIAINATNTPGDFDSLYKITQPGSYYLTANIDGVANKSGIEIAASNVSIDLGGFAVIGTANSLNGISTSVSVLRNIVIRNGAVSGWTVTGIDLFSSLSTNSQIIDVHSSGNGVHGIQIGRGGTIRDCTATYNTGSGIVCEAGCVIIGSSSGSNTANGFVAGSICVISDCSAYLNGGSGFTTESSCTLRNCSSSNNSLYGIRATIGSNVQQCTANFNNLSGIWVNIGGAIAGCTAYGNVQNGIMIGTGGSVIDCTLYANQDHGISASNRCKIIGNSCSYHSNGFGILAGSNSRIEANNCTDNSRGITVNSTGTIIIRNTCSDNAMNWEIAAGNALAPIVSTTTNAAPVAGNTYSGNLGTTDPNANFSY